MLEKNQTAPAFSTRNQHNEMISLSDYKGKKNVVLYFYPKDDTPGCTMEALDFTDLEPEFEAADTDVLGISRDTCVSHGAFRDKYGLSVRLLADADGEACEAFGVWQEKEARGEKRMGIVRSTFIIDKSGVVRHALYDVKPKGHAADVLELVKAL